MVVPGCPVLWWCWCPVSPMVGIFVSGPGRCPAHLSVIIPIEVTHKNVAPVAANFAPPAAAAAHILAAAFLGLELHLDPGRGLARRGELAKPATRTHSEVWKGSFLLVYVYLK